MKKILVVASLVLPLAACTQTERGAAIGAASGGIIGGAVTNDVRGAAVGAAVGGATGALIGSASEPGRCIYRDRYGRRYTAAC
ncbi:glycine zipper domain-containing protein [Sinorhizobium numidicum]|uniref:Glycine zipper domain-containing protein n=1 Tax=Sinorhizobium numidicum TaxID=680248 RepID=A0ABY8D3P7_9HYPH|nr:glycine zipper domain-containing protein [Sinorhizobium numidicum]WEX78103.1 glycine zipper domain-containing protein [Sinorhizobium numidicum]WEX84762.1 glycine zipper domain-containing protein [Sinorhizobium numidicum]